MQLRAFLIIASMYTFCLHRRNFVLHVFQSLQVQSDTPEEPSKSPNPRKVLLKFKRQMIKEFSDLEQFLAAKRRRFISLLAAADKAHTRFISVAEMLTVLNKIKAPLSQSVIEILLQVLEISDNGLLDYQQLINGSILVVIEEHFKSLESKLFVEDETDKMEPVTSEDVWIARAADLEKKHGAPGTLTGEHGIKAEHYKQEEVMQFSKLIKYCEENGIILNWKLAEKGKVACCLKLSRYTCIGVAFIEGLFSTQTVHLGPGFLGVTQRWPFFYF